MPFQETRVVDERRRFIDDVHRSLLGFSELCRRYGISRKTGYKWLARWEAHGPEGLQDRRSQPRSCPWSTPPDVTEAILNVRRAHPDYGAKKVAWFLERHRPDLKLPSRTTIHNILHRNILHRHGLVPKRRRRVRRWHPGRPVTEGTAPNVIWTADFKGQFRTRDGRYCFPLTVQDMHSRFLVGCQGLVDTSIARAKPVFRKLFLEFGLPERIRTDNGVPFSANALGRLSRLSVWFVRLGASASCPSSSSPQAPTRTASTRTCTWC